MVPAFDGWGNLFKPLLKPLECLRLDHSAHLAQHPNQAARFAVIELLVACRAVDPRGLGD
jgi:hypothetical protein